MKHKRVKTQKGKKTALENKAEKDPDEKKADGSSLPAENDEYGGMRMHNFKKNLGCG
jgi:hypothetical protein